MLPRASNRGFYDAVAASCREAGLAPTFVEMADARPEQALLAVAAGAGRVDSSRQLEPADRGVRA